ncbi:hypothetical protein AAG570_002227 [Ranatra chinensis]|uniref:Uncharacterized protein n=1 Tax=Ranatra chinensis TaxID=642074 RepID=A0ABD0Y8Z0_9HEMI
MGTNTLFNHSSARKSEREGFDIRWLRGVAKHCIQALDKKGRPYVWQQDSAPCHTYGKSHERLSENFYDFTSPNVWPPNRPDLNPTDYLGQSSGCQLLSDAVTGCRLTFTQHPGRDAPHFPPGRLTPVIFSQTEYREDVPIILELQDRKASGCDMNRGQDRSVEDGD